ncbi:MAG: hypothetical protein SVR94_20070, partial [Pseudomonadota bacterium]|nr:hypothetical protein [Pseudomonadota bacterium]
MMVSLIIIQGYAGLKQIIIEFFFQISRFDILFLFLTCLFYSPILVIIHSVLTGNTKNISDISFSILFFSFISFVIITIFSSIIRKQEFHKLAERSMPLIQAIKQYSQDHNHPPKK